MLRAIKNWLYLPEGCEPLIRRLTGLITLPIGLFIWNWSQGGPGPYVAPAWRLGDQILSLPWSPQIINIIAFSAYAIASIFLIFGGKRKIYVWIPLAVLIYYGSRDFFACASHIIIMDFCLLLALALWCEGSSPTRRILQIALTTCYGFSTFQKLIFPDFLLGTTMQAWFQDGYAVNAIWQPLLKAITFPHWFWLLTSWATILLEGFLTFGLWFKRTRLPCVWLGLLLHGSISLFMDFWLIPFAMEMFTCYLAFFDRPPSKAPEALTFREPTRLNFTFALLSIALIVGLPLRIYFWPGRPINTLTLFDRTPWAFCMYLMRPENVSTQIFYEDTGGKWLEDSGLEERKNGKVVTRMATATADNELYAISDLVFARHTDARAVRVDIAVSINKIDPKIDRWMQKKSLIVDRSLPVSKVELTVTNTYFP